MQFCRLQFKAGWTDIYNINKSGLLITLTLITIQFKNLPGF